jgi:choice-of-anchor B domain-containing protein
MRSRAILVIPVVALLGGCGSDNGTGPAPSPSPSTTAAASRNMTLMARVSLAEMSQGGVAATSAAGNWGYTSPGGRRFALTGLSTGTSIVEVTNPSAPRRIAFIEGPASQWREIKTFGTFVYVTTEARGHGLDIIDMSNPDSPRKVQTWNQTFQSAHSLWIDPDQALLFANGTSFGMRVLDLGRDPANPRELSGFTPFYVHDSYSRGNVLYAAAINGGFLSLLDFSNPGSLREITRFTTGGQFTHNAWLSRDGRYVFTTDERLGRPVEVWDILDPLRPRKAAEYIGTAQSIPHNVMVDGDRLLVAHYTEGVHLLDVRNPERPGVMGFYDTYTGPSGGFSGAWGAYIFPGTNLITVDDIQGGLFVVEYTGG